MKKMFFALFLIISAMSEANAYDYNNNNYNGGNSPYYNPNTKSDSNYGGGNSPYYNPNTKNNSNYGGGNSPYYTPNYGQGR